MKKRTRVVAWICAIYFTWAFMGGVVFLFASSDVPHISKPNMIVGCIIYAILFPAWIGLLKRKPSAWKVLTILYIALLAYGLSEIPRIPGYWMPKRYLL